MTKAIVETVGSLQYQDLLTNPPSLIRFDGPTLVTVTPFVAKLCAQALLTVIRNNVPETATDAEFLKVLEAAGGDAELAADSYISEILEAAEGEAKPKKAAAKKDS